MIYSKYLTDKREFISKVEQEYLCSYAVVKDDCWRQSYYNVSMTILITVAGYTS